MNKKISKEWLENTAVILTEIIDYGTAYDVKYQRLARSDAKKKLLCEKTLQCKVFMDCGIYSKDSITYNLPLLEKDRKTYLVLLGYINKITDIFSPKEIKFKFMADAENSYQMFINFNIDFNKTESSLIEFKINKGFSRTTSRKRFIDTLKEQIKIIDNKIDWLNEKIELQEWPNWIFAPVRNQKTKMRKVRL